MASSPLGSHSSDPAVSLVQVKRAEKIGVSWEGMVEEYKRHSEALQGDYEAVYRERVMTPDYYVKPFHAYKEGNLCWEAAMEVRACDCTEAGLFDGHVWVMGSEKHVAGRGGGTTA